MLNLASIYKGRSGVPYKSLEGISRNPVYDSYTAMPELQIPNPAVLKDRQSADCDLESQRPSTILTRQQRIFDKKRSEWFQQLYYRRIIEIMRPIAQPILVQSMYTLTTRVGPAEPTLPTLAIESHPLATLPSTKLPEPGSDSANSRRRQQIDDSFFDRDEERARPRQSSCASASSVSSTFVSRDGRTDNHKKRKEKIIEYLDPLLPLRDAPRDRFILICWGESNECHIKSVFFEHVSTESAIWSSIHQAWSTSRGPLRNLLKRYLTIKNVEVVTMLIAGKREAQAKRVPYESLPGGQFSSTSYIGAIFKDDTNSERRQLKDDIANYVPQEWPCAYNYALGTIECDPTCITGSLDVPCPERELFKTQRKLLRLDMNAFRRLAFMDPSITTVHSVLDWENTVYSRSDVENRLDEWHCPSLGELPFRAIHIEAVW